MTIRYVRVKSKLTGNEFDLPVERFNETDYSRVSKTRYPETTRPRRPKIKVNLAEGRRTTPVKKEKE